jgi:hypothetical protein
MPVLCAIPEIPSRGHAFGWIRLEYDQLMRSERYDLQDDPAETRDVAKQHPALVRSLDELTRRSHTPPAR